MGTNYYLYIRTEILDLIHKIHLGKKSGGWVFCFQKHEGLMENLRQAKKITKYGTIKNEYGDKYSYSEFWSVISSDKGDAHDIHCENIGKYDWLSGDFS